MGFDAFNTGCDILPQFVEKNISVMHKFYNTILVYQILKMPLLVHEMPFLSGFNAQNMKWPLTLIESLLEIENIVAIKEDAKEVEYGKKLLNFLNLISE